MILCYRRAPAEDAAWTKKLSYVSVTDVSGSLLIEPDYFFLLIKSNYWTLQ